MNKHLYTILYVVFILVLALILIVFEVNDIWWMILTIVALLVTSIFTYSTRKRK